MRQFAMDYPHLTAAIVSLDGPALTLNPPPEPLTLIYLFKLLAFLQLTNMDPFAAWFVEAGEATPDGIPHLTAAIVSLDGPAVTYPPPPARAPASGRVRHWRRGAAEDSGRREGLPERTAARAPASSL